MDLAEAGLLDYGIPFDLIQTLSGNLEDGLIPFSAMFEKLTFLKNILATTEAYGHFEVRNCNYLLLFSIFPSFSI